jgi:hypothetical protein
VFGALLLLLVIYFIRRDGLHHPCLAQFRAEEKALPKQKLSEASY